MPNINQLLKAFTLLGALCVLGLQSKAQNLPASADSANQFFDYLFNKCHNYGFVYKNGGSGCHLYIPLVEGDTLVDINQSFAINPFQERSHFRLQYVPAPNFDHTTVRYLYPQSNYGEFKGLNLTGTTKLSFWARGNGSAEFSLGGANRRPFYDENDPSKLFQDGIDVRSTGVVALDSTWNFYSIDLLDSTWWVYRDPLAGANNKFPEVTQMGIPPFQNYFIFEYNADDGAGKNCMKFDWFGGNDWGGFFLLPPEGAWFGTQGYNLSGITKVKFKAKISTPGNVKVLFGKAGDSCGELQKLLGLDTTWTWYEWLLPTNKSYSDVGGGFGMAVSGDPSIGTPYSRIYLDSVYYEGVALKSDFSQIINGFTVVVPDFWNQNQDTVIVEYDEVKFDVSRHSQLHFAQSFEVFHDSIDVSEQMTAHVYDNALFLLATLAMYQQTLDSTFLQRAIKIGDAFIWSMTHDRAFLDTTSRNVYATGDLAHSDNTARIPGWWDGNLKQWNEDIYFVGSATGNVGWVGLALLSLYQASGKPQYLDGARAMANWCLQHTKTNFGFTGGYSGWVQSQESATWKSSEHNIDLYALFIRLFDETGDYSYYNGAANAWDFVYEMWDSTRQCFLTGTIADGYTRNESNIASDVQFWYIQAFNDSNSYYTNCMHWVRDSCYVSNDSSPHFSLPLYGFDFNNLDQDGVWMEGTAQAAVAYYMINEPDSAEKLIEMLEYVQANGPNGHSTGIVAAPEHHLTTGFDWEYHYRRHLGATAWFVFAKLGVNPYYLFDTPKTAPTNVEDPLESLLHVEVFPNPMKEGLEIYMEVPFQLHTEVSICNAMGQIVKRFSYINPTGNKRILAWNGEDDLGKKVSNGYYFLLVQTDTEIQTKKILLQR